MVRSFRARRRVAVPLCVGIGLLVAMVVMLLGDSPTPGTVEGATRLDRDHPDVRRAIAQTEAQRTRHTAPAARRERQRSRTRYRDLDAARALSVGRAAQPGVLRDRTPRPLAAAREHGMVVARYASDYAAVLRPRNPSATSKTGAMAMSTLPLRSRDTHGQLRSVNMALETSGDQFVPDNAAVKVSIGNRVGDGFRVSARQVGFVPLDVAADAPGVVSGDAVFFANSDRDADHIVRVIPGGAESLVQLRSIDSPQRFRYRVDLPNDGTLQLRQDGSISVNRDGHRVGTIAKPIAWDADQQPIPVTTTLRGNTLVLDVAHRGRDIRYPAIVDPTYTDLLQYRWDANDNVNSKTRQYWEYTTNVSTKLAESFNTTNVGGAPNGLYSISRGAQVLYGGSYGYWRFMAPGTTAVAQVEWTHMSHSAAFAGGPAPCIGYGLILNTTAWFLRRTECANFASSYRVTCWDCDDTDGFTYYPTLKGAQFGTEVYTNTAANLSDFLGQATVYLVDIDDPTVAITSQPPTGWTNNPTGMINANATDPGLGVESIAVTGAGSVTNTGCLYAGPCPSSMPRNNISVASLNLPEGDNSVIITAYDASYFDRRAADGTKIPGKHHGSATAHVRVDRTRPTLSSSGNLNDARNGFVSPNQDYTLSVTARDGAMLPASAQRSGVTSLTATLDGQLMTDGTASAPCARPEGSCELTIQAKLTGDEVDALDDSQPHTIEIKAIDALGHEKTDSYTVRVDAVAPAIYADGSLVDLSGRVLSETSYRLRAEARDNQPFAPEVDDDGSSRPVFSTPGAGLRDLVIRLDGEAVATTPLSCIDDVQCEDSRSWDWDATNAPNGPHTITITATDQAGNESVDAFDVTMAHRADEPPRTNQAIRRTIKGAALGDRAGSSVAALGDVNGDGRADYAVGAPGASASAGAAYIVLGSQDASTLDLASPGSAAARLAGPEAGDFCGMSVAAAGDVNDDGMSDILVGCPGVDPRIGSLAATQGKVYVVFGRSEPQDLSLATLNASNPGGFVINGPLDPATLALPLTQRPAVFGERLQSVATDDPLPDVNDDGIADIVVGDSAQPRGDQPAAGAAYVVFGKTDGEPVNAAALGLGGYVIRGTGTSSLTGYSAVISDDLDGDTVSDIIVGAPAPTTGRAFVVNGGRETDVDLASSPSGVTAMTSGEIGDRFGVGVAATGDTNLDGRADIAVATRAGAYVVRNIPSSSQQISADEAGWVSRRPRIQDGVLEEGDPEISWLVRRSTPMN